jgi:spermidine/putrescine transport system ATP-binding protein
VDQLQHAARDRCEGRRVGRQFHRVEGRRSAHGCEAQGAVREELPRRGAEGDPLVSCGAARHRGHRRQGARPGEGKLSALQQDLEVDGVTKRYGAHAAVDRLSLAVPHGSFFSILGPSGCGKTTLLRIVAGFVAPDEGDVRIGGRSMAGVPPNRRPVNMVFQHLALFPMMSVGDNVGYGLARRGMPRPEIASRVDAMLKRVGLPGARDKRIDQLSGGQKQRVAIARSLVLDPALLLLDEPLGALDLKLREHMKIELKQLQADFGTTFVYITHDQSEALVLSDRVAVMNAGRFEQVGTPQELYYAPRTPFVAAFVGANNRLTGTVADVRGEVLDVATSEGLRIRVKAVGSAAAGDAVEVFVRPEGLELARDAAQLPPSAQRFAGHVESLLFDGASSAVLVRETRTQAELRIALPQTGRLADLRVGEAVAFGFDAQRAVAFAGARA